MTGFALVMAGAAIAALLLMLLMKKKTGIKTQSAFIFGALAVPLCILIGRAGFWICNIEWQKKIGASFLERPLRLLRGFLREDYRRGRRAGSPADCCRTICRIPG